MIRRWFALPLVVVACGPGPGREVIPRLPGDGTANVEPPPAEAPVVKPKDPWAGRTDLITPPPSPPPRALALPPIERWTLPNGLQVVVVKDDRLPTVAMQLVVRAGAGDEPPGLVGVAELTADLLPKGAGGKSALQIAKAIDFVGGTITADATLETTWITCAALAKDAGTCLGLVPDMAMRPSFPADELAYAKQVQLAEVGRRLDDAGALANAHLQNLLWGDDHPRGRVVSAAWVNALRREDLIAWHKAWFAPNNATLAIAGAVDVPKLKAEIARRFGGWKKAKLPPRPPQAEPAPRAAIRLVDKPGQTQTEIRLGQLGLRHDDPRFFATLVWNDVLGGGGFASRLMTVVRSEAGKTYGASSSFDRNLERGAWVATTFTRTGETLETVALVRGELEKMAAAGPTDDEVAAAIAHLAGGYALRMDSADDLAAALITADLHGLSEAYVANFPLLVGKVTRDEAAAAAAELLTPDNLAVVLVGDGDKLAPVLEAVGMRFERVEFTKPIGPQPGGGEPAAVDPAKIAAGTKILDAAIAAKGARITTLKALKMTASGTLVTQGQTLPVTFKRTLVLPDKMRMDIELAKQFNVVLAVTAGSGWQSGPGGLDDLPAAQLAALAQQRFIDGELILVNAKGPGVLAALVGTDKVGSATCDVVAVRSPDGIEALLLIDQKTKLLRQTRYMNGAAEARETYDDYRLVDGLQIAHKRSSAGGDEKSELTVESVEIDPTVDPAVFAKPK
ncbi:MAG: insulinase family protein [Kofleriaceae bacterium]|jgi:zinc protease|nr:insulinase family protein [Kofleriaceae bacterium]MBP9168676.1 insulinase family protein [Kofleriaceae bacterium]MBP9863434.1 insulinase family protein [Kofleriaceae bacterium]